MTLPSGRQLVMAVGERLHACFDSNRRKMVASHSSYVDDRKARSLPDSPVDGEFYSA